MTQAPGSGPFASSLPVSTPPNQVTEMPQGKAHLDNYNTSSSKGPRWLSSSFASEILNIWRGQFVASDKMLPPQNKW